MNKSQGHYELQELVPWRPGDTSHPKDQILAVADTLLQAIWLPALWKTQ